MPFIATCTYCRASKFRVPFKKRGTFATCPKCTREFLLTPETGEVPLMSYKELPFEDEDEIVDGEGSSELMETVPDHEPITEQNAPSEPIIESVAVVVSPVQSTVPVDLPLRFALVAVGLFGLGMFATLFPYGRLIAAPLTVVGALLAGMAWLGLDKYSWLGSVGTALNGSALILLLVFPSWLGLGGWVPEDDPQAVPRRPLAVSKESGAARPAEWVDAGTAVWEYGDVRVVIEGVKVEQTDPAAKTIERRKDRVLRIAVKVENIGVARAIPFASWHSPPEREVKLTAAGAPVAIRPAADEKRPVYPNKSLETTLTFSLPEKFDDLRLELPGSAFEGDESPRFQIPKTMIVGVR